jgi:hypothetical protein
MNHERLIAVAIVALSVAGCGKNESAKSQANPPIDFSQMLKEREQEKIHLLALKHKLPPDATELATHEYRAKHNFDIVEVMKGNSSGPRKGSIATTVHELAAKHGLDEEKFVLFLIELRLGGAEGK